MVYSETKTVPVDSRNTLIRNRDDIKARLGVEMYFPRSGVRGGYQDMVLKGTTGSVSRAIREVNNILASWRDEYEAFMERKRARKLAIRQENKVKPWPSLEVNKEKLRVVTNNMFDVLAVEDDEEKASTVEVTEVVGPKPVKPKAVVMTGWAAMAAKPAKPAVLAEAVETVKPAQTEVAEQKSVAFSVDQISWPSMRKDVAYNSSAESAEDVMDEYDGVWGSGEDMTGVAWGDEDAWADE